jgi:predicted PurR-regulated permease PerM
VFFLLGYGAPFTLAVFAAVLQFVPVVGPSVLVAALASVDFLAGNVTRAVLVAALGMTLVGFAPDAVIRPRLAKWAAHLPMSLYFIGFTGGVLTVGPIGFIAGPLAVAVLVEVVSLLADEGPTGTQ